MQIAGWRGWICACAGTASPTGKKLSIRPYPAVTITAASDQLGAGRDQRVRRRQGHSGRGAGARRGGRHGAVERRSAGSVFGPGRGMDRRVKQPLGNHQSRCANATRTWTRRISPRATTGNPPLPPCRRSRSGGGPPARDCHFPIASQQGGLEVRENTRWRMRVYAVERQRTSCGRRWGPPASGDKCWVLLFFANGRREAVPRVVLSGSALGAWG